MNTLKHGSSGSSLNVLFRKLLSIASLLSTTVGRVLNKIGRSCLHDNCHTLLL